MDENSYESLGNGLDHETEQEVKRLTIEVNKAWDETLGRKPVFICDNEYHRLPVIPKSGSMSFEHNSAD